MAQTVQLFMSLLQLSFQTLLLLLQLYSRVHAQLLNVVFISYNLFFLVHI
jgi:hypothetical protein